MSERSLSSPQTDVGVVREARGVAAVKGVVFVYPGALGGKRRFDSAAPAARIGRRSALAAGPPRALSRAARDGRSGPPDGNGSAPDSGVELAVENAAREKVAGLFNEASRDDKEGK